MLEEFEKIKPMQVNSNLIEYFDRNRKKWDAAYFGTGPVEGIPVYAQLHEYAMSRSSLSGKEFYRDGKELVRWEAKVAHELGLDIPDITFDCYNIEAEALGARVQFYKNKAPELVSTLLEDKRDLLQLSSPNPYKDGRMPFVLEIVDEYEDLFGHFPRLNVSAPFTLAANLRGVQQFLLDLLRDKAFVRELIDFVTEEVLVPYIEAIQKTRTSEGEIIAADAIASPPNLNLDLLEELALEPLLELKKRCGEEVIILNWWGESQVKEPDRLLELKYRAGSGAVIEGQDPDVAEVGPEIYSDFALSKDSSLILGMGTEVMMRGDPTSIKQRVKRYLQAGTRVEDRFLLYFTNFVGDTPLENIEAALKAVREYKG